MTKTRVIRVDAQAPDSGAIADAASVLLAGGLAAIPTETVYGLAAVAFDVKAVRRIFEAKGRPRFNPLITHVRHAVEARSLVADWPETAEKLAAAFWPGPLTLVLRKADALPDIVTAGGSTAAIRCPAHPVALAVLQAVGKPLAAPSANRSERLSPTTAAHVLKDLDGKIDLLLDAGPAEKGIESTVVEVGFETLRVLRPGSISAADIAAVAGKVVLSEASEALKNADNLALPSPGMLPRHYSPQTPLLLATDLDELEALAGALSRENLPFAVVGTAIPRGLAGLADAVVLMPDAPAEYAATLYSTLHRLDELDFSRIVVLSPPDSPAWAAVADRLRRAAGKPTS